MVKGIVKGWFGDWRLLFRSGAMGLRVKENFMIVLHPFSWQQFLVAALVLTLIWYALIGALYFRREIADLFSGRPRAVLGDARLGAGLSSGLRVVAGEEEEPDSLLGAPRDPEGFASVPMHQFSFAGGSSSSVVQVLEEDEREAQLGLVPDLLEELKEIFYLLERNGGDRSDFEELFQPVAARFESVITTPSFAAVNAYILENVPFALSESELEAMWEGPEA